MIPLPPPPHYPLYPQSTATFVVEETVTVSVGRTPLLRENFNTCNSL